MSDNIMLIDMDGTLFDYEGQLRADLIKIQSPGEELPVDLYDETKPWIKARMDLVKSQAGWWRNLPKFELGWDIYHLAQRMGFHCHILTKGPQSKPLAWSEKVQCIDDHFGDSINVDIVGKDKSTRYGRVLVDDYPEYVLGWLEHRPRGLAILPAQKYNEGFEHPNAIRYTGTPENFHQVAKLLRAVKARKSGEPWILEDERT